MADIPAAAQEQGIRVVEEFSRVIESLRSHARQTDSPPEGAPSAGPEIDVGLLMDHVRAQIGALRPGAQGQATQAVGGAELRASPISLPRAPASPPPIRQAAAYALGELLAFNDEEFIRNAYRALVKREPDTAGFTNYLRTLREGGLTKVEIIADMLASAEARRHNVHVAGLARAVLVRRWRRIPVLGPILGIVEFLLRMPVLIAHLERQEIDRARNERALSASIDALSVSSESALNSASRRAAATVELYGDMLMQIASLRSDVSTAQADIALRFTVEDALTVVDASLAAIAGVRSAIVDIDNRKADLATVNRNLGAAIESLETLARGLQALDQAKASASDVARRFEAAETQLGGKADAQATARRLEAAESLLAAKADAKRLEVVEGSLQQKADAAEVSTRLQNAELELAKKADAVELARRLEADEGEIGKKADASDVTNRLAQILRDQADGVIRDDHALDDFYVSFEDRFRGSPEDIKERVSVYLPIVREAGAGATDAPILDVGCGRGEWLELLKESGLVARGLDLNGILVEQCRGRGLDVAEADVIDYLRGLEAASLGAITGMHIIEHMPFRRLVALFDEAARVLRPGGVAIFETPNPENMIVGSCNFWYDPTHLQPLPPLATQFLAQTRGFARVEVMRLHPYPQEAQLIGGGKEMREKLNSMLFGPQDYSILAFKAS